LPIGDHIRDLRWDRRLKQGELAHRAGIAQNTLSQIELGKTTPSVPTLEKIARGLNVDLSELLLEEPVFAEKAEAPPSGPRETVIMSGEERGPEDVPGWVTEWLRPDLQRAGEALDEYCREWTQRQQRGEFDRDAIERFFEDAAHWTPVVEPALIAEARQLILSGQVPLDPNIAPNDLGRPEFLDLLDRLFSTGKVASAWSRWMDLQHEFLAQAEAQAEEIDPKFLERIAKETEEREARIPTLRLSA
jgi:transcriptional regulator with XRE-family HTH domain